MVYVFPPAVQLPLPWNARSGVGSDIKQDVCYHILNQVNSAHIVHEKHYISEQRYEVSLLCPEGTQTLTHVQISQIFSSCLQLHTIDRC